MALRGSLKDLGIVELLRMASSGEKTGELLVAGLEKAARLYYVDGRAVHAEMGELEGQAAVAELLAWKDGEFEFRAGELSPGGHLDIDLDDVIARALRERAQPSGPGPSGGATVTAERLPERSLTEIIEDFVASQDSVVHAEMVTDDGQMVAAGDSELPARVGGLRQALWATAKGYPRASLQRVLVEDRLATVVMSCLDRGTALIVTADRTARLGAVSHAVGRLARQLKEKLVQH